MAKDSNSITIRIDIRSSIHMLIFAIVAISVTIFLLNKASEAIDEINRLAQQELVSGARQK